MFCNECGEKVSEEDEFCLNCGSEVDVQKKTHTNRSKILKILGISALLIMVILMITNFFIKKSARDVKGDIRNVSWGMTKKEVMSLEKNIIKDSYKEKNSSNAIKFQLTDDEKILGFETMGSYFFDNDNKLRASTLVATPDLGKVTSELEAGILEETFSNSVRLYMQEYGEPDDYDDIDGYAIWEIGNTMIILEVTELGCVVINYLDMSNYL